MASCIVSEMHALLVPQHIWKDRVRAWSCNFGLEGHCRMLHKMLNFRQEAWSLQWEAGTACAQPHLQMCKARLLVRWSSCPQLVQVSAAELPVRHGRESSAGRAQLPHWPSKFRVISW